MGEAWTAASTSRNHRIGGSQRHLTEKKAARSASRAAGSSDAASAGPEESEERQHDDDDEDDHQDGEDGLLLSHGSPRVLTGLGPRETSYGRAGFSSFETTAVLIESSFG
jgi:hypothetical protein